MTALANNSFVSSDPESLLLVEEKRSSCSEGPLLFRVQLGR